MNRVIEPCGDQYAVWNGNELIGVYDSYKEAEDAMHNWDSRIWKWKSLHDVEVTKKGRHVPWYKREYGA